MQQNVAWGVVGVLVGGLLNGSFVAPMKRLTKWQWENSWLVYSIVGLIIVPWVVVLGTVPHVGEILRASPMPVLVEVCIFGFGWGIGSVLFGLGVSRLGLAVGYGVILGLIAPIGTFLPLIILHPEQLRTRAGYALINGTLLVIIGIVFLAVAGKRREREASALPSMVRAGFWGGLAICVLSGIFSPMLNFSFVFGQPLQGQTAAMGVDRMWATGVIWALTLTAGFVVNAGYCVYLLQRNGTWGLFSTRKISPNHFAGASLMGVLCFGSFMAYGIGASALGSLGGIVGWPVFMAMSLITSNVLGAATGEWTGASRRSYAYSVVGIALLIIAIIIISRGGTT